MLEVLINTLKIEWAGLSAAPWSFVITLATAFALAFATCRWAYQTLHETSKGRVDALKERLAAKDEQLDEYRRRLNLIPTSGSKFSQLTQRELQEQTLRFVEELRKWFSKSETETRRIADQQWNALRRAETEEQRHQLWEAHTGTHTNGFFTTMQEFEQKFKVDAILIRDELVTRLPAAARDTKIEHRYEFPTNSFGIKAIADDLERMAKLLQ